MKRISEYFIVGLISIVFLAAGLGISVFGWIVLQNARVSAGWPTVQGQIVESTVRESTDEDGTSYFADVRFRYVVDDQPYTADTVNFGQYGSSDPNHAQEIVSKYEYGGSVLVYYDPEKPQTAVLQPGTTWSSFFILGFGSIFALIGLGMFLLFWFRGRGNVRS